MLAEGKPGRSARVVYWVAALLLVGFGLLALNQVFNRWRGRTNPQLMADLQDAKLPSRSLTGGPDGEWPQWRGPFRDGVSREKSLSTDWAPTGPPVLWKVPVGEGFAAVAVSGGRVYTVMQQGGEEVVLCLDAATGNEVWRFPYPCRYDNSYGSGPRSTPCVDEGHVYSVGGSGIMHCLDAVTGEKIWRHDLLSEFSAENLRWGVSFSPLVYDGKVFTMPGGPGDNCLVAFDKLTGELIWKNFGDEAGYSSPVLMEVGGIRQVLFFTAKNLVSVSPDDGKIYWRYSWPTSFGVNAATPIVVGDYVFISSGYGKGCGLLKVSPDGAGGLRADSVYENTSMRNHFSSSVRIGEYIYGFDDFQLVCMELRTGEVRWEKRGFQKGSVLGVGDLLVVLGERGKLAVAVASPEGYQEEAAFQLESDKSWTVPVLANGRLYIRDEHHLTCFDVRPPAAP